MFAKLALHLPYLGTIDILFLMGGKKSPCYKCRGRGDVLYDELYVYIM